MTKRKIRIITNFFRSFSKGLINWPIGSNYGYQAAKKVKNEDISHLVPNNVPPILLLAILEVGGQAQLGKW